MPPPNPDRGIRTINSLMDPWIIPAGPVADHEVSSGMPVECNHRRQRHPPLLQATEWMKAMYSKPACQRRTSKPHTTPNNTSVRSQGAALPTKERPLIRAPARRHSKVKVRRPQIPERKTSFATRAGEGTTKAPVKNFSKPLPAPPVTRGAEFPRIDYGPVDLRSALHSHPPSDEEVKYSVWLSEGWQVWREKKQVEFVMMNGAQDGKGLKGKSSKHKLAEKPSFAGLRGLYNRR